MSIEIKVPTLPESVTDATVAKWYCQVGDTIERDQNLVDLETDKVMLEVPAPTTGVITEIKHNEGDTVNAEQVLAILQEGAAAQKPAAPAAEQAAPTQAAEQPAPAQSAAPAPAAQPAANAKDPGPSARRAAAEKGVDTSQIAGSGRDGRVTKSDVKKVASAPVVSAGEMAGSRSEKRVPMSRLRQRIAERLVEVQHSAAILTTFNEIDMKPVMDLRSRYKDQFEKAHGIKLGFMSFFAKAAVEALKRFPAVNSSLDGTDMIYHNYCDIGVAVGSPRGLVVPVLRNVENLSMADVEKQIKEYAIKAKEGKLAIDDMTGGTFTITNGGIYGSMMSTPIINPPQTAILGMHNIVERPIAIKGEVVVRPVMYIALSYDHRVIDGAEAVSFLVTIKQMIEDPARLLLEV